jgi:hypothetical protein
MFPQAARTELFGSLMAFHPDAEPDGSTLQMIYSMGSLSTEEALFR